MKIFEKYKKLLEKSRKNQGKISHSSFWKIFDKYKKYWKSQRKIRDSLFWKIFYKYNKNWKSQGVCHLNTSQKWEPCIYVYKIRLCYVSQNVKANDTHLQILCLTLKLRQLSYLCIYKLLDIMIVIVINRF